ncbi:nickel-containing superoxide dismutase [Aureococcus anophagefferens]|nr:nickel-containing superoxide dismutase [Aureococcus anophagefferens]
MKTVVAAALVACISAHCQVPCGIFDDPAFVAEIRQHTSTIKKAMAQITALSSEATPLAFNQMTRWVNNKESHAEKIITAVSEYSLCQPPSGAAGRPSRARRLRRRASRTTRS